MSQSELSAHLTNALGEEVAVQLTIPGNPEVGTIWNLQQLHRVPGLQHYDRLVIGDLQGQLLKILTVLGVSSVFSEGHIKDFFAGSAERERMVEPWQERFEKVLPLPLNHRISDEVALTLYQSGAATAYAFQDPRVSILGYADEESVRPVDTLLDLMRNNEQGMHRNLIHAQRDKFLAERIMKCHFPEAAVIYGIGHALKLESFGSDLQSIPQVLSISCPQHPAHTERRSLRDASFREAFLKKFSAEGAPQLEMVHALRGFHLYWLDEVRTSSVLIEALKKLVVPEAVRDSFTGVAQLIRKSLDRVNTSAEERAEVECQMADFRGPFSSFQREISSGPSVQNCEALTPVTATLVISKQTSAVEQTFIIENVESFFPSAFPRIIGIQGQRKALQKMLCANGAGFATDGPQAFRDFLSKYAVSSAVASDIEAMFVAGEGVFRCFHQPEYVFQGRFVRDGNIIMGPENHLPLKEVLDVDLYTHKTPIGWIFSPDSYSGETSEGAHRKDFLSAVAACKSIEELIASLHDSWEPQLMFADAASFEDLLRTVLLTKKFVPTALFDLSLATLRDSRKGIFANLFPREPVEWSWDSIPKMSTAEVSALILREEHPSTQLRLIRAADEINLPALGSATSLDAARQGIFRLENLKTLQTKKDLELLLLKIDNAWRSPTIQTFLSQVTQKLIMNELTRRGISLDNDA